ncbi:MAG: transposase [Spirochaetales bacterium]|nr:transposase [Spirochaetales bacterium]
MKTNQPGFFDFDQRMKELGAQDPLTRLNELVHWDDFKPILEKYVLKEAKAPGGRPRYDLLIMFKVLVLQRLYNLSDAQTEYQRLRNPFSVNLFKSRLVRRLG